MKLTASTDAHFKKLQEQQLRLEELQEKISLTSTAVAGFANPIFHRQGFNLLDYFGPIPPKGKSSAVRLLSQDFWLEFDFVRIPMINAPIPISN